MHFYTPSLQAAQEQISFLNERSEFWQRSSQTHSSDNVVFQHYM